MAKKRENRPYREKWGNKYYVVVRDKGKITARRKWSKNFTIEKAASLYRANKSLKPHIKRTDLYKVSEFSDSRGLKTPKREIKSNNYQYFMEGKLRDGKIISARSNSYPISTPIRDLREECAANFYGIIGYMVTGVSDADEGKLLADLEIKHINEGVIYYKKKIGFAEN